MRRQKPDFELLEEAIERPITTFGRQADCVRAALWIHRRVAGCAQRPRCARRGHGSESELHTSALISYQVDCKAINALSHTGSLKATQVIRPGHVEVMHHLMPIKACRACVAACVTPRRRTAGRGGTAWSGSACRRCASCTCRNTLLARLMCNLPLSGPPRGVALELHGRARQACAMLMLYCSEP